MIRRSFWTPSERQTNENLYKSILRANRGVACSFAPRLSIRYVSSFTARLLALHPAKRIFRGSKMSTEIGKFKAGSPMADTLRMDRMPHIWCPGGGIGSEVNSFAEAVKRSGIDTKKLVVVSGIGCTGRVAGYVNFDSIHNTPGRAIPVATGVKLANPELTVVVFSGEGDLSGIGGNHLIHAARRNMDIVVICNNNFTYGMTGGQVTPTTPGSAVASTTPYGNYEYQ